MNAPTWHPNPETSSESDDTVEAASAPPQAPSLRRFTAFTLVGAGAGFVTAMEASKAWGGGEVVWELMAFGGPMGVSLGGTTALATWGVINVIMYALRPASRGAPPSPSSAPPRRWGSWDPSSKRSPDHAT